MHSGQRYRSLFDAGHELALLASLVGGGVDSKFHEALAEELIAFAERRFREDRKLSDGATARDHNEAVDRIRAGLPKAKQRKAMAPPRAPCPAHLAYLWGWFADILNGSSGGGMGPATIAWVDIAAWQSLTGETIERWEASIVMRLSTLRANIEAESGRKDKD